MSFLKKENFKYIRGKISTSKDKAVQNIRNLSIKDNFNSLSKKSLLSVKQLSKKQFNHVKTEWRDGYKTFLNLKKEFKGVTKEDLASTLKGMYKDMSKAEALKIAAAVVLPGGIPVYAIMKLQQYRKKQGANLDNANENTNTPTAKRK